MSRQSEEHCDQFYPAAVDVRRMDFDATAPEDGEWFLVFDGVVSSDANNEEMGTWKAYVFPDTRPDQAAKLACCFEEDEEEALLAWGRLRKTQFVPSGAVLYVSFIRLEERFRGCGFGHDTFDLIATTVGYGCQNAVLRVCPMERPTVNGEAAYREAETKLQTYWLQHKGMRALCRGHLWTRLRS